MGASYGKAKKAASKKLDIVGRWTALPHIVIHSEEFRKLSYAARSLLFDIAAQYNASNNGKLVCCTKYLKPLGWNSNGTIYRALKELKASGLIIQTRQGMMPPYSQAAWFAIGWFGLDVTEGLDINPKLYQRSTYTTKKVIKPIKGARKPVTTPLLSVTPMITAPKIGAIKLKNEQFPTPIKGEFIYLPSTQATSHIEKDRTIN